MEVPGLMHIGVYTKDIDVSLDFYRNKLGFTLVWRGFVPRHNVQFEAASIVASNCAIELVKPPDLSGVHSVEGPVQHIALSLTDLKSYVDEITAHGVVLEEPISFISLEGGMIHTFIRGPSNERIELAQRCSSFKD